MQPRIIGRYRRADGSVVRCDIRIEQQGTQQRHSVAVEARERAAERLLSSRGVDKGIIEPRTEQDEPIGKL